MSDSVSAVQAALRVYLGKVDAWNALDASEQSAVIRRLLEESAEDVAAFTQALRTSFGRSIERVVVLPLFGISNEFGSVADALGHLKIEFESPSSDNFAHVEVQVRYSNGDHVGGQFRSSVAAQSFLEAIVAQG